MYKSKDLIIILNSDYICNLNELVKSKFQSIETKNLKITQIALYFSIITSLFFPIFNTIKDTKKIINTNSVKVINLSDKNKKSIDSLSFGHNVEVLKKEENYYLIEYTKNNEKKIGWVEKNSIKNIYFWEKY